KATSERNTKTLRELVKRPENKVCADCKRNDPRWASWNLGVFVCIRCSGIHRSMGTHISKVKSVDLDMWTPEQMASVQKWGNRRANLYWEAHLKAGHVPPDHKIESFIRSKYESRRWAMEGPPPSDPSVLESGHQVSCCSPRNEG
ncbi:Arf GTPase activating protein, partial [Auricularia subglabra TFB-10046 SS5]